MKQKDSEVPVEVRRSRNRLRTVTAYRDGDRVVVAIPARFTRAQEREWVRRMVARLADQERRRRPSDDELAARAAELSTRYLGGRATPKSVNWSTNQGRRWGSCTPADGTIRISTRVRGMPRWVIDYVLLHELAHLLHIGHGPEFWATLEGYPRTERARGFLEGVTFGEERVARGDPDVGAVPVRSPDLDPEDLEVLDADVLDAEVVGAEIADAENAAAEIVAAEPAAAETAAAERARTEIATSALADDDEFSRPAARANS